MVSIPAATVDEYLAQLPEDRRAVVSAVRKMVKKHLPKGFQERASYGMIGWEVPLAKSGPTYNGQPLCFAGIAAQKHHYSLYLTSAYMDPVITKRVQDIFKAAGKRLDMGKSCVRFRSLDAIPLDDLGPIIAAVPMDEFIERYHAIHAPPRTSKRAKPKSTRKR
ncbi:MAG: iron chaperone [Gemmatimonadales bacterium]